MDIGQKAEVHEGYFGHSFDFTITTSSPSVFERLNYHSLVSLLFLLVYGLLLGI